MHAMKGASLRTGWRCSIPAAVAVFVLAWSVVAAPASAEVAARTGARGISVYHFNNYSWSAGTLSRYGSVVTGDPDLIRQIKRASPSTLVLNYRESMGMQDNCGAYMSTCSTAITFQQAQSHDAAHPNDPWILRDGNGNPIANRSFGHIYLANVGSPSYQRAWAASVIAVDKRQAYDGTFMDNVLADVSWWTPAGVFPSLYPSDSAWQAAMTSFMRYVGPHLKARHLYVRASAGKKFGSAAYKAWWRILAPDVSGLEVEYFQQANADYRLYDNDPTDWHGDWAGWESLIDVAQNAGVDFYGGMQGTPSDTAKMMYGKASFLLRWNGRGGGFFWQSTDAATDPWNPAWTTDVGRPLGRMQAVGAGWRRTFSRGTVIVNPSASSEQTFNLGATYRDPTGRDTTSVTLAPVSAMILTSRSR
jgi:putative glycosyl hydrolase-like family 15 (GHL15) protein